MDPQAELSNSLEDMRSVHGGAIALGNRLPVLPGHHNAEKEEVPHGYVKFRKVADVEGTGQRQCPSAAMV
jgi:hypothetical protein